jgi:hypothetical protein
MTVWVATGAIALTLWVMYDIHKNRDKLEYIYLPAPTIGSVRPPTPTQIGPITNEQNSPWMGGGNSLSWGYIES